MSLLFPNYFKQNPLHLGLTVFMRYKFVLNKFKPHLVTLDKYCARGEVLADVLGLGESNPLHKP